MKLAQQLKNGEWFMHCPCGQNWVASQKETFCPRCKQDTELTLKLQRLSKAVSRQYRKALRELGE